MVSPQRSLGNLLDDINILCSSQRLYKSWNIPNNPPNELGLPIKTSSWKAGSISSPFLKLDKVDKLSEHPQWPLGFRRQHSPLPKTDGKPYHGTSNSSPKSLWFTMLQPHDVPPNHWCIRQARLRGLLSSKTATDVTEAISVVVELRLRGVGAVAGWAWNDDFLMSIWHICLYVYNRRKFRSQTSDNMDRWKAEQGRGREKRKIRREKSRRERVRRKKMQMREKVGKSRFTVFFQWFVAPEGRKVGSLKRRVRSQLARWEMKNCTPLWREAHFQVKMYKTHSLSDHFWKLRCRKSARRCGAKHISKSKCTKH